MCVELTDHAIQSGPSSLKWNENPKPASVTNPNDPPSEVDCSDCNLRGLSINGTGNLIFDRKIRI